MTMKTPTNVLELMENLLNVFRSHQVFDEAFYTEENVKKITAAQQVDIIRHHEKPLRLEAEAAGFWDIADKLTDYGAGLSVDIQLEIRPDGKKSIVIYVNVVSDQPLLHYLAIEKLVGYPWQPCEFEPWGSNRLYREPTDPYGNKEREYRHLDGNIEEKGVFTFDPAGLLDGFTLRCEER